MLVEPGHSVSYKTACAPSKDAQADQGICIQERRTLLFTPTGVDNPNSCIAPEALYERLWTGPMLFIFHGLLNVLALTTTTKKDLRLAHIVLSLSGNAALKTLLKGAKFLFSDGLNNVYQKSGGYAKALDDFNSVNTAKRVRNFPYPSKGNLYVRI